MKNNKHDMYSCDCEDCKNTFWEEMDRADCEIDYHESCCEEMLEKVANDINEMIIKEFKKKNIPLPIKVEDLGIGGTK